MISKHISDKEGVYSTTATRRGINNKPTRSQREAMVILAEETRQLVGRILLSIVKVRLLI